MAGAGAAIAAGAAARLDAYPMTMGRARSSQRGSSSGTARPRPGSAVETASFASVQSSPVRCDTSPSRASSTAPVSGSSRASQSGRQPAPETR